MQRALSLHHGLGGSCAEAALLCSALLHPDAPSQQMLWSTACPPAKLLKLGHSPRIPRLEMLGKAFLLQTLHTLLYSTLLYGYDSDASWRKERKKKEKQTGAWGRKASGHHPRVAGARREKEKGKREEGKGMFRGTGF